MDNILLFLCFSFSFFLPKIFFAKPPHYHSSYDWPETYREHLGSMLPDFLIYKFYMGVLMDFMMLLIFTNFSSPVLSQYTQKTWLAKSVDFLASVTRVSTLINNTIPLPTGTPCEEHHNYTPSEM